MTDTEKEALVTEIVEKVLLRIPEVIGNLIVNHAAVHKLNMQFYKDHPEFKEHRDVVQSVVEMVEGKNPLLNYEEILGQAAPEINHRLQLLKSVNATTVKGEMPTDFSKSPHGEM